MSRKSIDDMLQGRRIVLEENGYNVDKIDAMTSNDEIMSYIQNFGNGKEKNSKYLYSIAAKRFLPDTQDGGMLFRAFYDSSPQTTGDAAEVALQLMERGRGHSVKREVKTPIVGSRKYKIFGGLEELTLKHRDSDLVVTHEDGKTVHIESKVGLTRGSKKKYDLMQECLGDVYRLDKDPKTSQQYVIFRNANNGLSQLDDRDYVKNLYHMKNKYGDRVQVNYEGKYLTLKELQKLSNRERGVEIPDCLHKGTLKLDGKLCEIAKPVISENIDSKVRAVNACNEMSSGENNYVKIAKEHGKTSNFGVAYAVKKPSPLSKFATGFVAGSKEGAKYGAIYGGVDALAELIAGEKPTEEVVMNALKDTAVAAVRSGVIVGVSNLSETLTGKKLASFAGGVLFDSAKAFCRFCDGKIGAEDLANVVLHKAISAGVLCAKRKLVESVVSGISSWGVNHASGVGLATGTAKFGGLFKGFKVIGGTFLACALVALAFKIGAEISLPRDPRVVNRLTVDKHGRCLIQSGMSLDMVSKIIKYNEIQAELDEKISKIKKMKDDLRSAAKQKIQQIVDDLRKQSNQIENEILRQAERISDKKSKNFKEDLKQIIEDYVERNIYTIKKDNIRINELREIEQNMRNQEYRLKTISDCCKNIIDIEKNGKFNNEKIKGIVNDIANSMSDNTAIFRTNNFTTASDILVGCLL